MSTNRRGAPSLQWIVPKNKRILSKCCKITHLKKKSWKVGPFLDADDKKINLSTNWFQKLETDIKH